MIVSGQKGDFVAKVAVVLSGCGVFDGSEVRESVLALLALSESSQDVVFLAPNLKQHHVINHQSGQEALEARNVMEEAARIARGPVLNLLDANPQDYDAVVFPGGYGVAKNLCSFAFRNTSAELDPDLVKFLLGYTKLKNAKGNPRPIAAICIAPVILALWHKQNPFATPPVLTIGDDEGTASAIVALGCVHQKAAVQEAIVDSANRLITTPAYMYGDAPLHHIATGIRACVGKMVELINA